MRALLACLLALFAAAAAAKLPKLTLAGPYAAVSFPLIHMVESGALADVAERVEFVAWKDPDQLRVLALKGQADFLAMPSNVAANLYNRGVPLKLINVSTWGVLWLISRNGQRQRLADFRGEEIAMPFRADMPDIVFGLLAQAQGLDARRDFRLRYVASPLDAMQLLVTRRVDHALLAEPAASMALRKTRSFPVSLIAPELYRSVDLQQEWGRAFGTAPRIPQAGVAVLGQARQDARLIERLQTAYAASLAWCQANPDECGRLVARRVELLSPEAVADSIAVSQLRFVPAAAARPELEAFFGRLLKVQPALIGGRLPDAGFYGGGAASAPATRDTGP